MKSRFLIAFVISGIVFTSCKKDGENPGNGTSADRLKDSVLMYTKDLYLWYAQIPSGFKARNYADPDKIMSAIREFSIEPGFAQPVDRWSFAYKQKDWDDLSSGITKDFGLNVFFRSETDLRVRFVEKESPAGRAGIRRGWRIMAINANENISTSNAAFVSESVYATNSASFRFQKADGSSVEISLQAATYQQHPVFLDTVLTVSGKKAGYLVFNSFLGDTTEIYGEFQRAFSHFNSEGINDVIVDLRYNGGGFVSVQDKLANYLVNASGNGNIMMNQQYNDKYASLNFTTRFVKSGSLNLNRVFFIVSKNTASASELLINNLKPYMDVKLVGPENTYGKPVGFFPMPVDDWYIFPVSFRSTNKNGQGNYFNGFLTDSRVPDGLDKDWGDRNESCLGSILAFIGTGSFSRTVGEQAAGQSVTNAGVQAGNAGLDRNSFKGMVDARR